MVRRDVVAARRVEVESSARRLKLANENRCEVERIKLHQLLQGKCLGRLQQRAIARDGIADPLVRELDRHFVQLRWSEEEERTGKNHFHEVERIGDAVGDVFDPRAVAVAGGDQFDQCLVVMDVAPRWNFEVIVDRSHLPQHFAELVHLPIFLRDEIEQVGVEGEA